MIRLIFLSIILLLALTSCHQKKTIIKTELTEHEQDIRSASHVVAFKSFIKGRTYGTGSHVTYLGKTVILTNRHVCDAGLRIDRSKTLRVENTIVKIIKIDTEHDLCAVEPLKDSGLTVSSSNLNPLDKITLIGHPRGLPTIIRKGAIVNHNEESCVLYYSGIRCLMSTRISAIAYPGNSGSPVLNTSGQLVGVLFAGRSSYPHEPLIVPHSYVIKFLDSLKTSQQIVEEIIKTK